MSERKDQYGQLSAEVDRTRDLYRRAYEDFRRATSEVPSGLPSPDGSRRILNSSDAARVALERYSEALKNFGDYVAEHGRR